MKRKFFAVTFCILTFFATACVPSGPNAKLSTHGETATPLHVISDARVTVSPIRVYVRPDISPTTPLKGLFVPLRVTQDMASPKNLSYNLSRQIYQVWLAQKAFVALEYNDYNIPFQVSDALALARSKGANVLIGGYISNFLDGGTVGTSTVSIQIEMYEVATGSMIWSLAQGASIEKKQAVDLFTTGYQERMPEDAAGLMVRSVGFDIGDRIARWVRGMPIGGQGHGQVF